jgi:hypothetical protein
MVWGPKKSASPPQPAPPAEPTRSPDEIMSEMLTAYQSHFYNRAKGAPDPSIAEAKSKIDRANKLISESRIGYSLCRFAQQHDDGRSFEAIPGASDTTGKPSGKDDKQAIIRVNYGGVPYTLLFVDKGMPTWTDEDSNSYGTIQLYAGEDLVCGIDASADQSRGFEYARWGFDQASAFAPGEWMRHIVEMAALLDAYNTRVRNDFFDKDTLERGSKMKF